ncbi:hypothetical protein [Roseateles oligotrophus]|uniref:Bacteriocin n=1 Tax=Roseateles oligotrophus TaxID=1769250 RepID=A0ABT2YCZ3_9BURK|nr:hypothetical protein [Roseateles oligotrophus]MCV2367885.1 hypothetical protein [Roseateles oligotrophus]
MKTLTQNEISVVAGGDSWAGTPAGRAPVPTPEPGLGNLPWVGIAGTIIIKIIMSKF